MIRGTDVTSFRDCKPQYAAARDRAQHVVGATSERIADARQRYRSLVGKTFTLTAYRDRGSAFTKNAVDDVLNLTLREFGPTLAPRVTALPSSSAQGLAAISGERLGILDANLVIVYFSTPAARADAETNPQFRPCFPASPQPVDVRMLRQVADPVHTEPPNSG